MFAAVPLDVRKAYGFPSTVNIFREAMPPARGAASLSVEFALRKGGAFPHIKRHSRGLIGGQGCPRSIKGRFN
jgi:hypothetical protein